MSHGKPYSAYKASGASWLGSIPEHWCIAQLSKVTKERCDGPFGSGLKSEHYQPNGVRVVRLQNIGWAGFNGYDAAYISEEHWREELGSGHGVEPGDVLIAGLGDDNNPLGRACVAPDDIAPALVKADCYRFRVDQKLVIPAFTALALSATARAECGLLATGATRDRLNLGLASARRLPIPPLDEQRRIVSVLDRETASIDALIAKKTRFIELLKEKRQALITHAVTKGLDPKAKMKDSGVDWIGEIPSDWIVGRLRDFCTAISTGPFGTALGANDYVESGIPVINPSHMEHGCCAPAPTVSVSLATAKRLQFWALRKGDVVAARRGELGRAAIVRSHEVGWICGTGSLRLAPNQERITADYIYSVLQSSYARAWLAQESVGSTMPNLNEALIGKLPLAIPSTIAAQASLRSMLETNLSRLAALIAKTQRSIDLLKERRSALITAAVTGQIDLRESP
ncbi:restriction endonuclease subunit S [Thiocystis violacea]|uniref:restriction endonuclease subunit S n=1 Tax=Thiocystis violacea TaxID=13725 RepID=UPI001904F173|nr:restriction endonuclease subunit S [Thiocystis violacea]MBK1718465.1 hypothetical protein [Thiocystis violacea]